MSEAAVPDDDAQAIWLQTFMLTDMNQLSFFCPFEAVGCSVRCNVLRRHLLL